MSKSPMSRSAPSETGLEYLTRALANIRRVSCQAHDRRVGRMAVSFVPRGLAAFDDTAVALDEFRMLGLSFRWCDDGRGGMVRREPLAVYRAEADLGGTGRIRFVCRRVHDLLSRSRGIGLDPRTNPAGGRDAVLMHQAVEDALPDAFGESLTVPQFFYAFPPKRPPVFEATHPREVWEDPTVWMRIGTLRAWPAAMFVRPRGYLFEVNPIDQTPNPWVDGGFSATGEEHGSWILREGIAYPKAQIPEAVYAIFSPELQRRMIRNPAWSVLRSHRVLDDGQGHRAWIDALCRQVDGIRHFPNPTRPDSRTGRVREAIEAYVSEGSGRQEKLMADLRAACRVLGMTMPRDAREEDDLLIDLLDNPWLSTAAPGRGAIQLVSSAGGPSGRLFSDGIVEADFNDTGSNTWRYEDLPRRTIREALHQRFGRKQYGR